MYKPACAGLKSNVFTARRLRPCAGLLLPVAFDQLVHLGPDRETSQSYYQKQIQLHDYI
jgi:hypothetical protein